MYSDTKIIQFEDLFSSTAFSSCFIHLGYKILTIILNLICFWDNCDSQCTSREAEIIFRVTLNTILFLTGVIFDLVGCYMWHYVVNIKLFATLLAGLSIGEVSNFICNSFRDAAISGKVIYSTMYVMKSFTQLLNFFIYGQWNILLP